MKYYIKVILLTIIFLFFFNCRNKNEDKKYQLKAEVEVMNKEYNFGKATRNDTIKYTFLIKNLEAHPYVIDKVGVGCGCTTTNFTKTKVLKEKLAKVEVVYVPSSDDLGTVTKSIVVSDNSIDAFHTLCIKGEIIE